jgi:hypothetical protein
MNDTDTTTTVHGTNMLYGYSVDGLLNGRTATDQVASTMNGRPAFHLNGQYVSVKLSGILPSETANLWTKYSGNPVLGTPNQPEYCDIVRNPSGPNGGDWYCFGSVSTSGIGRFESSDLIHWTSPTIVLPAGPKGAWDETVVLAKAFQDPLNNGEWVLFYRGDNSVTGHATGMATSIDGLTFTRKNNGGVNDGLLTGVGSNYDITGAMLVGTTYYIYADGDPSHQTTNVYTSTDDLKTFTPVPQNPIFVNAFCPTVWKTGNYYYMLIARDLDNVGSSLFDHGIALYRSTTPLFDRDSRQFLGYAAVNDQVYDGRYLDTPSVPTTDIYRTTYAPEFGDTLYMVYSGTHTPPAPFMFTQERASTSLAGLSSLPQIPESVTELMSSTIPTTYSFWVQFDSLTDGQAVFSVGGGPTTGTPVWLVNIKSSGGGKVLALFLGGAYSYTSFPLATDTPYHVSIVDNVSDKEVYIDGSLVGTFSAPIKYRYSNPAYLYLGAGEGKSFQGYIGDFRQYPEALSTSEVHSLYMTGSISH